MNSPELIAILSAKISALGEIERLASADLLDAEPAARSAAEAFRALASAFLAVGKPEQAASAESNAAEFEALAAELAASPRIAADRRLRDALASRRD